MLVVVVPGPGLLEKVVNIFEQSGLKERYPVNRLTRHSCHVHAQSRHSRLLLFPGYFGIQQMRPKGVQSYYDQKSH
jgi:hypothetical protein